VPFTCVKKRLRKKKILQKSDFWVCEKKRGASTTPLFYVFVIFAGAILTFLRERTSALPTLLFDLRPVPVCDAFSLTGPATHDVVRSLL